MQYNIMIVGVGGQGTLLASRVLGALAVNMGLDCKLSEVHGMAQRGGSVVTFVRIADKVYSPIIAEGKADIIVSFEKLELARWRHFLKKGGTLVVNNQEIAPLPVITGAIKYPHNILDTIKGEGYKTIIIDAEKIATACGNIKTVNTIMMGVLAKSLGVGYSDILQAVKDTVPQKLLDINIKALEAGFNAKI